MRILAFLFAAMTLPLAGCYTTGDLGDYPFRCTADRPECPDGYICGIEAGLLGKKVGDITCSKGNCYCVRVE